MGYNLVQSDDNPQKGINDFVRSAALSLSRRLAYAPRADTTFGCLKLLRRIDRYKEQLSEIQLSAW